MTERIGGEVTKALTELSQSFMPAKLRTWAEVADVRRERITLTHIQKDARKLVVALKRGDLRKITKLEHNTFLMVGIGAQTLLELGKMILYDAYMFKHALQFIHEKNLIVTKVTKGGASQKLIDREENDRVAMLQKLDRDLRIISDAFGALSRE